MLQQSPLPIAAMWRRHCTAAGFLSFMTVVILTVGDKGKHYARLQASNAPLWDTVLSGLILLAFLLWLVALAPFDLRFVRSKVMHRISIVLWIVFSLLLLARVGFPYPVTHEYQGWYSLVGYLCSLTLTAFVATSEWGVRLRAGWQQLLTVLRLLLKRKAVQ
jgi:hypothetical protein